MFIVMRQYYLVSAEYTWMFNQHQLQPNLDKKKMLDKQKYPLSIKQESKPDGLLRLSESTQQRIRSLILQLLRKIKPPY